MPPGKTDDAKDRVLKRQTIIEEEWAPLMEKFQALRPEMLAAIEPLKTYEERTGEEALSYLSDFLEILDNQPQVHGADLCSGKETG